jgi:2',3'-cyclic-nucleotide 2'-phosphodiesterase (5'-nucleotidase family)
MKTSFTKNLHNSKHRITVFLYHSVVSFISLLKAKKKEVLFFMLKSSHGTNSKLRKATSLLLALTFVLVLFSVPVLGADALPQNTTDLSGKLVIIHTNDTHGGDVAVEGESLGTAGIAQLVKDYEAAGADVLLISAGDAIQGDPLVNLSKGLNAIEFMNLAGYDLMVPGNHEFDFGYDNLIKLNEAAEFPFVSANILDKSSGKTVFEASIIFDTEIGKVGFFGLTTPETMTKANPNNVASLNFLSGEDMYEAAKEQVEQLEKDGAEHIICVAHLGTDESSIPNRSIDLIDNVEGIDILIDGHSHSILDGHEGDTTIIASAGTKLSHAGVIIIDDESVEAKLISAEDYNSVDKDINDEINKVAAQIDLQLSDVFAKTEILLDGNRAPGVRTQETNLGDFAADAILWSANQATGGNIDGAITNGGGIRASIAKGDITMKDMKTVFPFGNTISTVKVTGSQLLEVLEASASAAPEALGAFPQVSGIEFTIDTTVPYVNGTQYPDSTYFAPANPGARVTDVKVGGVALDLNKTYTIATNDFLAAGGDTYYLFKDLESYNTYVALEDALINYTEEVLGGVISEAKYGKPAGRINIITAPVIEEEPITEDKPKYTGTTYTVVKGDCLWVIAERLLGDGRRYIEIYELNKDIIKNPNLIYISQVLKMPAK